MENTQLLKYLHGAFVYFIEKENFIFVNEMMNQFSENSHHSELRMILITLKSWKEHKILKENYNRVEKLLNEKTNSLA